MGAKVSTEVQRFASWHSPLVHCVLAIFSIGNNDLVFVSPEDVMRDLTTQDVHDEAFIPLRFFVEVLDIVLNIIQSASELINVGQSALEGDLELRDFIFEAAHVLDSSAPSCCRL